MIICPWHTSNGSFDIACAFSGPMASCTVRMSKALLSSTTGGIGGREAPAVVPRLTAVVGASLSMVMVIGSFFFFLEDLQQRVGE